jgi:hypothetical protein
MVDHLEMEECLAMSGQFKNCITVEDYLGPA